MVRLEAERDAALLKAGLTRADLVEHVAAGSGISAEEERALRAQVRKRLRVIVHTHTLSYTCEFCTLIVLKSPLFEMTI